jgi:catechol 2,3-dioxygenase-like lactoylglutathione lyase family enzyme
MNKVKGIGGIFKYSSNAARLADWYQRILGVRMERHPDGDKFFKVFQTRDLESSTVRDNPVFAIYQTEGKLASERGGFMLNLRVDDLSSLLESLRAQGIQIEPKILEWEHGKHAWIRDGDGNRIELYEEII